MTPAFPPSVPMLSSDFAAADAAAVIKTPCCPNYPDICLYFKCCRLSYTYYELHVDPAVIWESHNLRLVHKFVDPQEEVAYVVHEHVDPETHRPLQLIFAFRGMLESFDFADFNPFSEPSVSALNRKTTLLKTRLVAAPEQCGGVGKCHQGMAEYFFRAEADLALFLRTGGQPYLDLPIVVTGFSMGCALSTLAALMVRQEAQAAGRRPLIKNVNLCPPKLGNRAFSDFAYQQLDMYASYYIHEDPVASFPPDPDYVMGGHLVVLSRNSDPWLSDREWKFAVTPYTSDPHPHQRLVTKIQMDLGIWQGAAIPHISVFAPLVRTHHLGAFRKALHREPISVAELEALEAKTSRSKRNVCF